MTLRVLDLRAENVVGLLGTEVRQPRLSWRLEDEGRGQAQAAFRIRAAHTAPALESGELLWDSGVIESDASLDIPYGGPPLKAMQRVWWSVEVQAADGAAAHSEAAWFEAGLLGPEDWRADWIEAEDETAAADRAAGVDDIGNIALAVLIGGRQQRRGPEGVEGEGRDPAHPAHEPEGQHRVPGVVFDGMVLLVGDVPLLDALQCVQVHGLLPAPPGVGGLRPM